MDNNEYIQFADPWPLNPKGELLLGLKIESVKGLERCEEIFGFNLEGYGKIRIYGFLAERYLSYWFD